MNRQRIPGLAKLFVESFGKFYGPAFRFNLGEIAVIRSDTGHHPAQKWGRARRELPKQGFCEKTAGVVRRDVGNDGVLRRGESNLAVPVNFRKPREFIKLFRIDSARGNAKSNGTKPLLLLPRDAEMVGMRRAAHVPALKRQFVSQVFDEFRAQTRQAPLFDQESKTASRTSLARPVITIDFGQFYDHCGRLKNFYKDVQRRGNGKPSRAHLSAHQHVETDATGLFRGNQSNVLRLCVRAIVQAASHSNVELARQVGELWVAVIADNHAVQILHHGRGIQQFVLVQSREWAAIDVSNVVNAGLQ